jgi:hypothetical protein
MTRCASSAFFVWQQVGGASAGGRLDRASCIRKAYTVRRGDNGDGTAFVAFDIPSFPPELVIATSEDIDVNYTPTNQELPKPQFAMAF